MSLEVECSDINTRSELTHAILVYTAGATTTLATVHEVDVIEQKPTIKAGNLVTKEALKSLFDTLNSTRKIELLPENILAQGDNFMAWYTPPQNKALWFKCEEMGGEVSGVVPLPGLVFFVSTLEKVWFVFAYKGKERPNKETMLYNAPFLNVWAGGKICEGNILRPHELSASSIGEWEDIFFRSRFTHTNHNNTIGKTKGGAYSFWKQMLAKKWKKFPESKLIATERSLQQCFDDFLKQGGHHE